MSSLPRPACAGVAGAQLGHPAEALCPPDAGSEHGGTYAIPGAAAMDADGFWRLGLHINLELGSAAFAFWIAEQNGDPITKIADRTWKLDFSNQLLFQPATMQ
jgi:hypothetical protein